MVLFRTSIIAIFLFIAGSNAIFYNTIYMSDRCGTTYTISNSAVKVNYASLGYTRKVCVMTLKTLHTGRHIIFNFDEIEAGSLDSIDIFDGPSTTSRKLNSFPLSGTDYGTSQSYRSTGSTITIRFNAFSSSSINDGFHAVATSSHTGTCWNDEYACCDGDCIDGSLRFDGVNNCRDYSDEWSASGCLHSWAIGLIVGVVVFFSILFFSFLVCCIVRRRRRLRYSILVGGANPTYAATGVSFPAPQPPVYPYGPVAPPPYANMQQQQQQQEQQQQAGAPPPAGMVPKA